MAPRVRSTPAHRVGIRGPGTIEVDHGPRPLRVTRPVMARCGDHEVEQRMHPAEHVVHELLTQRAP
jgi:hypothetical protein